MERKIIPFGTYEIMDHISFYLSSIEEKLSNEEWHYIKDLLEKRYGLRILCTMMYCAGYQDCETDLTNLEEYLTNKN